MGVISKANTLFNDLILAMLMLVGAMMIFYMVFAKTPVLSTTPSPPPESLVAAPVMTIDGDGSGVIPDATPNGVCDCRWENGIVSGTPFSMDRVNGMCYFSSGGKTVLGNLDLARKVCHGAVDGKPVAAVSYFYLTGSGCAPIFKTRQHCSPAGAPEPVSGVCMTEDGRFGGTCMVKGMWTCSTSNGTRAKESCAAFSYEVSDHPCKIPPIS